MKLRAKTNEEYAEEYKEFLYNPPPEWVEYNHFEHHYDKVDGEYYLKKEERIKKVKIRATNGIDESLAEKLEKPSQDRA